MVVQNAIREPTLLGVGIGIVCQVVFLEQGVDAVEVGNDAIFGHVVLAGKEQTADGAVLDALANTFYLNLGHAIGVSLDIGVDS